MRAIAQGIIEDAIKNFGKDHENHVPSLSRQLPQENLIFRVNVRGIPPRNFEINASSEKWLVIAI